MQVCQVTDTSRRETDAIHTRVFSYYIITDFPLLQNLLGQADTIKMKDN